MSPANRRALARLAQVQQAQRNRRLRQLLEIRPEVQAARLRDSVRQHAAEEPRPGPA